MDVANDFGSHSPKLLVAKKCGLIGSFCLLLGTPNYQPLVKIKVLELEPIRLPAVPCFFSSLLQGVPSRGPCPHRELGIAGSGARCGCGEWL